MLKASGYSEPRQGISALCAVLLDFLEHIGFFPEIPVSGIFLQIGRHKKQVKQIAFDYAGELPFSLATLR